ncbi:MAG: T9SS type A sorting domain-containing protein, partial [Flavobacteriia bacterium]
MTTKKWMTPFILLLLGSTSLNAQTFNETMGDATGAPAANNNAISFWEQQNRFDNDLFTMTGSVSANASIRNNSDSQGSLSAGNHAFLSRNGGFFMIEGVNTTTLTNIELSFYARRGSSDAAFLLTNFKLEVSSDGTNWTQLSTPHVNNTSWQLIVATGTIPSVSNLRIRFSQSAYAANSGTTNYFYRIDDVRLRACTPVSISGTNTNVTCNGASNGSIDVTAVGSSPIAYSWSNGAATEDISNVMAGTYTLTATNGCGSTTSTFTISQPAALSVTLNGSNYNGYGVSCFGSTDGSVDATANGGVAGYSYSWDNGSSSEDLSGLGAGSYSVTVTDANGCTATDGVVLVEPTKVNISATNTAILCNGQTSDVTVLTSGGVTPYSVDDAGSYTVPAGSYTYDVVDANGCSASTTIDITQPAVLTIDAGSDETVFFGYGPMSCADLNATVNGGTPAYSVSWTSTASGGGIGTSLTACPTSNESYTVSVVDANGCTASDQLSICVVDVTCYAGNSSIQKVQMCQVPPGNPANAHTICIDASAVPAHLAIGCQLGECGELAAACAAPAAKNMEADVLAAALVAYPNPTANTTTVSVTLTKAGNYSVAMYDMMGKLVKTVYAGSFEDYENLEFDVDMTNLNTGVYMI